MTEQPGDRQPNERQPFEIVPEAAVPVGPGTDASPTFDPTRLDFGHYAGRTVEELASSDPDYLRWLERHPSGTRYRSEIQRVLGVVRRSLDWER